MRFIHELVVDPLDLTWVLLGVCAGVALGYAVTKIVARRSE